MLTGAIVGNSLSTYNQTRMFKNNQSIQSNLDFSTSA